MIDSASWNPSMATASSNLWSTEQLWHPFLKEFANRKFVALNSDRLKVSEREVWLPQVIHDVLFGPLHILFRQSFEHRFLGQTLNIHFAHSITSICPRRVSVNPRVVVLISARQKASERSRAATRQLITHLFSALILLRRKSCSWVHEFLVARCVRRSS